MRELDTTTHRFLYIIPLLLYLGSIQYGCIQSLEQSDSATARPASCSECHSYPGSDYCRTDTMTFEGKKVTSCVLCHMGAVALDSSVNSFDSTVYHDLMLNFEDDYYPALDSLHTNDTVDVNFGQCTKCHGYPPDKDAHYYHINKKKRCLDCHLFSVQCSTKVVGDKTIYYPMWQTNLENEKIPIPDPEKHLNGISGDIVFKQKVQNASNPGMDKAYIWNSFEKTCSKTGCHYKGDTAQHYLKEIWAKVDTNEITK